MLIGSYKTREVCSLCRFPTLVPGLSLGFSPIANEYEKESTTETEHFPLDLCICESCGHVQLLTLISGERLYRDYVYETGTSPVTLEHLHDEAHWLSKIYPKMTGRSWNEAFVVELGSNDGSMLRALSTTGVEFLLGIDPSERMCEIASQNVPLATIINAPFTSSNSKNLVIENTNPDVIVANNVFAHIENVRDMAQGVSDALSKNGLFLFEVSYLLDFTSFSPRPLFDTIYHEHFSYHAIGPLAQMLDEFGLPIVYAERQDSQAGRGSLMVLCQKKKGRSIECWDVRELMKLESENKAWDVQFLHQLGERIHSHGEFVREWFLHLVTSGEKLIGYGAPAKLTTFMHVHDLGKCLNFVVEDNPHKQGLFTPGMHIPIQPPSALKDAEGTCIVFAWNFFDSIVKRNPEFKGTWTRFLPEFKEQRTQIS